MPSSAQSSGATVRMSDDMKSLWRGNFMCSHGAGHVVLHRLFNDASFPARISLSYGTLPFKDTWTYKTLSFHGLERIQWI